METIGQRLTNGRVSSTTQKETDKSRVRKRSAQEAFESSEYIARGSQHNFQAGPTFTLGNAGYIYGKQGGLERSGREGGRGLAGRQSSLASLPHLAARGRRESRIPQNTENTVPDATIRRGC
ncbi:hypothetical protein E2C01_082660 [Portunus trituberculatus]|uniref:Uncharacterized protein n=1 Tax=Portunus trituberculatus TaxID=210409 RepID=A0A5B7J2C0_PORTR|nr:hypothetical protein [Portunus trituberculatus]